MPRFAWLAAVLAVLAMLPASAALAAVPSTMSYQGVLTDAGGNLVPDGNYNLTFRIYDVAVAGAALYTENHPAVPVQLGGFSVIIGSTTPISLPFDAPYWLGIQVGADPELAPRVALAASPYGLSLRLPFSGTASSASALVDLNNTGSGAGLRADRIDAGSPSLTGSFQLYTNGGANPTFRVTNAAGGARLEGFKPSGVPTYELEDDVNGNGGWLQVMRSSTLSAFVVDGNRDGTEQPHVSITGASRSAVFDMGVADNASVALPPNAIAAAEIADEPGVAHINVAQVDLTNSIATVASRSITCPTSGYVVVLGSADVQINHVTGTATNVVMGVSNVAASLSNEQDFQFAVPAGAPSGFWDTTIGGHGVFAVGAGLHTFYLLAYQIFGAGTSTVWDNNLTLMFFPTAYGTVLAPAPQAGPAGIQQAGAGAAPGLTPGDLAAERAEAEAFNAARVQRELEQMRAELEALKLELSVNAQSAKER